MYQNTHQFYITEEFSQNTMGITYKFFSLNMDILTSNDLICRVAMKKKKSTAQIVLSEHVTNCMLDVIFVRTRISFIQHYLILV